MCGRPLGALNDGQPANAESESINVVHLSNQLLHFCVSLPSIARECLCLARHSFSETSTDATVRFYSTTGTLRRIKYVNLNISKDLYISIGFIVYLERN